MRGKLTEAGVASSGLSRLNLDLHLENIHAGGDINVTGVTVALARAASRFVGKVEEFLEYYAGTEGGPVPFGGRQVELERLDAWLDDSQASPRFLLSGPAGRGKSALLVRWMGHLATAVRPAVDGPAWRLVFFPISLRAGTNRPEIVYEAIAARCAEVLNVELPASEIGSTSYYQDWCRRLCDQIVEQSLPVLIVLDGLDEILGGDFDAAWFPRSPGPCLRLLAAARWLLGDENVRDWVKRLDWDHHAVWVEARDLSVLDEAGVRDVLASVGAPPDVLTNRPELVEKLWRLSEGEPLLLRLYAEDIWALHEAAGRLRLEDLNEIQPGFAGYFEKRMAKEKEAWKEERRRGAVIDEATLYAHLAVLACAYGRLRGPDLGQLVERAHGLAPGYRLEDTLVPVRRFIYGASRRRAGVETGYVLSHPKLGEFLQSYLDETVIKRTKAAFLAWGGDTVRRLNAGELEPEKAPPYLLEFYAQHLKESNAEPDQFLELVEDGWRRAWEAYEGGSQGFANDVQTAWDAIREARSSDAPPPLPWSLGAEIRCALCLSSLRCLQGSVPSELVDAALTHGVISWRQALHLAEIDPEQVERARKLLAITAMPDLIEAQRRDILADARVAVRALESTACRAEMLAAVAPHLPAEEGAVVLAEAMEAVGAIRSVRDRADVLAALAGSLPESLLDQAIEIAGVIDDRYWRAYALTALAVTSQCGSRKRGTALAAALVAANDVEDPRARAEILAALAPSLPEEQRDGTLAAALDAANAVEIPSARAEVLAALASSLPGEQRERTLAAALDAAQEVEYSRARGEILAVLAPSLPEPLLAEALKAAKAVQDRLGRACALAAFAPRLPDSRRPAILSEALGTVVEAANKLREEEDRNGRRYLFTEEANTLAVIAPYLTLEQSKVAAVAAWTIGDPQALIALLPYMPQEWQGAAIADIISSVGALMRNLNPTELAAHARAKALLQGGWIHRARNGVEKLTLRLLTELATLARNASPKALLQGGRIYCARTPNMVENKDLLLLSLSTMTPHLSREQLPAALAAAGTVGDRYEAIARADALVALGSHMQPELVTEALETARTISDISARAKALAALGARLPENLRLGPLIEALEVAKIEIELLRPGGRDASFTTALAARADAIAAIAPHLPPELITDAVKIASALIRAYPDGLGVFQGSRGIALATLVSRLPREQRDRMLAEMPVDAARALEEMGDRGTSVAPCTFREIPDEMLAEEVKAASPPQTPEDRARAGAALAPSLGGAARIAMLEQIIGECAHAPRASVLSIVGQLAPVLAGVGGEELILATVRAIRDTAEWWP